VQLQHNTTVLNHKDVDRVSKENYDNNIQITFCNQPVLGRLVTASCLTLDRTDGCAVCLLASTLRIFRCKKSPCFWAKQRSRRDDVFSNPVFALSPDFCSKEIKMIKAVSWSVSQLAGWLGNNLARKLKAVSSLYL